MLTRMLSIRRDLAFIADVFEELTVFYTPGERINLQPMLNNLSLSVDQKAIVSLVHYFNGECPIPLDISLESIKIATDFIGLRINIDFNNIDYENYLYTENPELFKERMKDLILRWKWSVPGQKLGQFENCMDYDNEYIVSGTSFMGEPSPFNTVNKENKITINGHDELMAMLPWYTTTSPIGLVLAGGSVVYALKDMESPKDYDLFIVAPTPEDAARIANAACMAIVEFYEARNEEFVYIFKSERVITFSFPDSPEKQIQIILRGYESPAQIINGFDIDACCVGFTPSTGIFMCTRASRALRNGWNLVDPVCRSPSYEIRLKKYYEKYNLGVYVPGLVSLPDLIYKGNLEIKEILTEAHNGLIGTFLRYNYQISIYPASMEIEGFYKLYLLFNIDQYSNRDYATQASAYDFYENEKKYIELPSTRMDTEWSEVINKYVTPSAILFIDPQRQQMIFSVSDKPLPNNGWYSTFYLMNSHPAITLDRQAVELVISTIYADLTSYLHTNYVDRYSVGLDTKHRIKKILNYDYHTSIRTRANYEKYAITEGPGQCFTFINPDTLQAYTTPYVKIEDIKW